MPCILSLSSLACWVVVLLMITGMVVMMDYLYFKKARSRLRKGNANHTKASNTTTQKQEISGHSSDAAPAPSGVELLDETVDDNTKGQSSAADEGSEVPKKRSRLNTSYLRNALHREQQIVKNEVLLASYYVRDAWAGRLENGLAKNSQESKAIFNCFKFQTNRWWESVNLLVAFCLCFLALSSFNIWYQYLSAACSLVLLIDVILKVTYMGLQQYCKKVWQIIYALTVLLILAELFLAIGTQRNHKLYILYSLRPVILCLRDRSMRNLVIIVRDMVPGFVGVCIPLVFSLGLVSSFSFSWFQQKLPNCFESAPSALFNYWWSISTGETYTDLLPPSMNRSLLYLSTFFLVLFIGRIFLLSMLKAVTYDVFIQHTKFQVQKDQIKEYQGLLAAFSILDKDQNGAINQQTFEMLIAQLKPELDDNQLMLYSELALNGENNINVINFLNLSKILSYKFLRHEKPPMKFEQLLKKQSGMRFPELKRMKSADLAFDFVSNPLYLKIMKIVTKIDLLSVWIAELPSGKILSSFLFLIGAFHFFLRFSSNGFHAWKTFSIHSKIALFAFALYPLLGILQIEGIPLFKTVQQKKSLLKIQKTIRLAQCWLIVEFDKKIQSHLQGVSYLLLPFFSNITFALIVAQFFAMIGMQVFDSQVEDFESTQHAVLTMTQLFFEVDVLPIINKCAINDRLGVSIMFFVSYYIIAVLIAFNFISALLIKFYSEAMGVSSKLEEEKKADEDLMQLLMDRVTEKVVINKMSHHSVKFFPHFRVARKNFQFSRKRFVQNILGQTKRDITPYYLRELQKYADRIPYNIDLLQAYRRRKQLEKHNIDDFEKELYHAVRSTKQGTCYQTFQEGDQIIQVGENQRYCYFVDKGTVNITYQEHHVATLRKGEMFGQDILLGGLFSKFNYIANGDVRLIRFDRKSFMYGFGIVMQGHFAHLTVQSTIELEAKIQDIINFHLQNKIAKGSKKEILVEK